MGILANFHEHHIFDRRIRVLADHVSGLIPENARVLDVGCGNGRLDQLLVERRPDLHIEGIDTLIRAETCIPVSAFDGKTLPFSDDSFDVVILIDVLHHADDPLILLAETARVTRRFVIIKDHRLDGFLAGPILRFMDWVGNARYGVALPYNYLSSRRWNDIFQQLNLVIEQQLNHLDLYRWPLSLVFERRLHMLIKLSKPSIHE